MDGYAQALAGRRGKSVDPSLVGLGDPSHQLAAHKPQDVRMGFAAGASVGDPSGSVGLGEADVAHPKIDAHLGVNGAATASAPHMAEHTPAVGEGAQAPQPLSQSTGVGGGELSSEVRDAVGGNASEHEYEELKGMKASSLGAKAKMGALKSKYEPAGGMK